MKKYVVITTINKPNKNIKKISKLCKKNNYDLVIIGDKKTPSNFAMQYGNFFGLSEQKKLKFRFSKICRVNSYARKNIGYLISFKNNSSLILETDDDNYPLDNFISHIKLNHNVYEINNRNWVNIYRLFNKKDKNLWPRGLPLRYIDKEAKISKKKISKKFYVQQGLCEGNPDVDAIYRILNKKINIKFTKNFKVSSGNAYAPLNSQNTVWFKKYFPLMYLPVTCTMRVTDIWRGIIALNIIIKNSSSVLFFGTTMKQIRNFHNIFDDLYQEMPLYKDLEKGFSLLRGLKFKLGDSFYLDSLLLSYNTLVKAGIFNKKELKYLLCWIKDCQKLL